MGELKPMYFPDGTKSFKVLTDAEQNRYIISQLMENSIAYSFDDNELPVFILAKTVLDEDHPNSQYRGLEGNFKELTGELKLMYFADGRFRKF